MFVTKKAGHDKDFEIFTLVDHKLFNLTEQFDREFHAPPNVIFLFSVSEHTEFIL
jgi:hypothetical protein